MNTRIAGCLCVLILTGWSFQSALAQVPDGTYTVSESWILRVSNGYTGGTNVYSGTYTGTIMVNNGTFDMIDKTGLAPGQVITNDFSETYTNAGRQCWTDYDGTNYSIHADYPAAFIYENAASQPFFIAHSALFRISIQTDVGYATVVVGSPFYSYPVVVTGKTLTSLTGSGLHQSLYAGFWAKLDSTCSLTKIVDLTKPTVAITSPTASQLWSNASFTAKGTASDNIAVTNVFYQLNGGPWISATTANGWANWQADLTIAPYTNTLRVFARDRSGNASTTNSVNFTYVLTAPLTVLTNGRGTISPSYNGALLQVGSNYSMTATAAAGYTFTGWTGSTTTNGATLKFLMASNLLFTANFADITAPALTITTPAANQRLNIPTVTAKGLASDNFGIAAVYYQLNAAGWFLAGTTNGYTNWSSTITLVAGTNTLKAYAADFSGNYSPTSTVSFYSSNAFLMRFTDQPVLSSNGCAYTLNVSTGLSCGIEVSTDLLVWSSLTNFTSTNLMMHLRDAGATNRTRRFYRAILP